MPASDYTSLLVGAPAHDKFSMEPLKVPEAWNSAEASKRDLLTDSDTCCSVDCVNDKNMISFSDTNQFVTIVSGVYDEDNHFHFPLLNIAGIPTTADIMMAPGKRPVGAASSSDDASRNVLPRTAFDTAELERDVEQRGAAAESVLFEVTEARSLQAVGSSSATNGFNLSMGSTSSSRPGDDTVRIVCFEMDEPADESGTSQAFKHWFLGSYYEANRSGIFSNQEPIDERFASHEDLTTAGDLWDPDTIFFRFVKGRFQVISYKLPEDEDDKDDEDDEDGDEGYDDDAVSPEIMQMRQDIDSYRGQVRENQAVADVERMVLEYRKETGESPPAWYFQSMLIYDKVRDLLTSLGIINSRSDQKKQEETFQGVLQHYGVAGEMHQAVREFVYSIALTSSIHQYLYTLKDERYASAIEEQLRTESAIRESLMHDISKITDKAFKKSKLYKELFSTEALQKRLNKESEVMRRVLESKEGRLASYSTSSALPFQVIDKTRDTKDIQDIKARLNEIRETPFVDKNSREQFHIVTAWTNLETKLRALEKEKATARDVAREQMAESKKTTGEYTELIKQKTAEIAVVGKQIEGLSEQHQIDVDNRGSLLGLLNDIAPFMMDEDVSKSAQEARGKVQELNGRIERYASLQTDKSHLEEELAALELHRQAARTLTSINKLASTDKRKKQSSTPRDKHSRDERKLAKFKEQKRREMLCEQEGITKKEEIEAYGMFVEIDAIINEIVRTNKRLEEIKERATEEKRLAEDRMKREIDETIPQLLQEVTTLRDAVLSNERASVGYLEAKLGDIRELKKRGDAKRLEAQGQSDKIKGMEKANEGNAENIVKIEQLIQVKFGGNASFTQELHDAREQFNTELAELRSQKSLLDGMQEELEYIARVREQAIAKFKLFQIEAKVRMADLRLEGGKTPDGLVQKLKQAEETLKTKQSTLYEKWNVLRKPLTSNNQKVQYLQDENLLFAKEYVQLYRKMKHDGQYSMEQKLQRKLVDYLNHEGSDVIGAVGFIGAGSADEDRQTKQFQDLLEKATATSKVQRQSMFTESAQSMRDSKTERVVAKLANMMVDVEGVYVQGMSFAAEKYAFNASEIVKYAKLGSGRALHYYTLLRDALVFALGVGEAPDENPYREEEVIVVDWKTISESSLPACANIRRVLQFWESIPSYFGARACDMPSEEYVRDMFERLVFKSPVPALKAEYIKDINEITYGVQVTEKDYVRRSVPIMFVNGHFVPVTDDLEVMWITEGTITVSTNTRDKMISQLQNILNAGHGFMTYTTRTNKSELKEGVSFETISDDLRYMQYPVKYVTDAMMVAHHDWRNEYIIAKEQISTIRREAVDRQNEITRISEYIASRTNMSVEVALDKTDQTIPVSGGHISLRSMLAELERLRKDLEKRRLDATSTLNAIAYDSTLEEHDRLWEKRSGRRKPNESITIRQVTSDFILNSATKDKSMRQWQHDLDAIERAMISSREFVKLFYPWVEIIVPLDDATIDEKKTWIDLYRTWMRRLRRDNFMYHQLDAYNNQALTIVNIPLDRSIPLGPGPTSMRFPPSPTGRYTYQSGKVELDVRGKLQTFRDTDTTPLEMDVQESDDEDSAAARTVEQLASVAAIQRVQQEREHSSIRRRSAQTYSYLSRQQTTVEVDRSKLQAICRRDMMQRELKASGAETPEQIYKNPTIFAKWVDLDGTVRQYVGKISEIPKEMAGDVARYLMREDQVYRRSFMVGVRFEGGEQRIVTIARSNSNDPADTGTIMKNLDEFANDLERDMREVDLTDVISTFQAPDDDDNDDGFTANANAIALDAMMAKLGLGDLTSLREPGKPKRLGS